MSHVQETKVSAMKIRSANMCCDSLGGTKPEIDWQCVSHRKRGEEFLKNLSVAAALILCVVTLRTGAIPKLDKTTDAVMAAATDQSLLDENLGKLSFVSALFPEAVLVFGENEGEALSVPVSGGTVIHAWSEKEPYMSWRTSERVVTASTSGEVIGVYHGNGDEMLVQIAGAGGISCMYGNLAEVTVRVGESISEGDMVGMLLPGEDFVFEVRRDGQSIDPTVFMSR